MMELTKEYLPVARSIGLSIILFLSGCSGQNENKSAKQDTANPKPSQSAVQITVPIHKAALDGNISAVKQFLVSGEDINILDEDGRTALMYASFNGHTEVARILIEKGADVILCDPNKRTPLMFAASGPFPETVRLLLENNADPNFTDLPEHFTALMYAAAEGHLENVRILLAHKADPVLKDVDGDDAQTFAVRNGHHEVAELIRSFLVSHNHSENSR